MIPEKIRIGPYDYAVKKINGPMVDGGNSIVGRVSYNLHTIEIKDTDEYSEQSKEQYLWHEMVHAILSARDIKQLEEDDLDSFATGLYQLMKDNPFPLPGQDWAVKEAV